MQGDRSRLGSSSSANGVGVRNGGTELETGRPLSATFGLDRRYSGGTIGIASMLGSLGTVISGRMGADSATVSRTNSFVSVPGTPPGYAGAGRSVPRRYGSVGAEVMAAGASYLTGDDEQQEASDEKESGASAVGAEEGRGGLVADAGLEKKEGEGGREGENVKALPE